MRNCSHPSRARSEGKSPTAATTASCSFVHPRRNRNRGCLCSFVYLFGKLITCHKMGKCRGSAVAAVSMRPPTERRHHSSLESAENACISLSDWEGSEGSYRTSSSICSTSEFLKVDRLISVAWPSVIGHFQTLGD